MIVDTGADVNVISLEVYNQSFQNYKLATCNFNLCAYGDASKLVVIGKFEAKFEFNNV